jgi:structural maintenance of chromosome 1
MVLVRAILSFPAIVCFSLEGTNTSLTGKSNLMDAVSFVVGVNTAQLRGFKLADFRSNLDTATDAPTSVTLHYHAPRQAGERTVSETLFTRTITSRDMNEWRVDGRKVRRASALIW